MSPRIQRLATHRVRIHSMVNIDADLLSWLRRVTDEQVIGHGEAQLDGGVGEVAAGAGQTGSLFGEAGGVGERAGWGVPDT